MTILSGPHAGHSVQVPMGTPRTFGRSPQSDVALTDAYLSDVHFRGLLRGAGRAGARPREP